MLGCGVQVAATRVAPSWSATRPGKIRSPSPSSRSVPHAKQVGNGCEASPGYDAIAARASAAGTGSTGDRLGVRDDRARRDDRAADARRRVEARRSSVATAIGVSSGGGWRSATVIAGHGAARSSGQSWSTSAASAPAVQPPLPDDGRPAEPARARSGRECSRHRLILSHRSSASRRSSAWSTIGAG